MHANERRLKNLAAGLAEAHREAHREPAPDPPPTREELDALAADAFRRLIHGADDDEQE